MQIVEKTRAYAIMPIQVGELFVVGYDCVNLLLITKKTFQSNNTGCARAVFS